MQFSKMLQGWELPFGKKFLRRILFAGLLLLAAKSKFIFDLVFFQVGDLDEIEPL